MTSRRRQRRNAGSLARARPDPTVLVFPIVVGPVDTTIAARYGLTPLPQLEAVVRGSRWSCVRDDGAYGYKENGIDRPRVAWPCVSTYVICAGGTQLGDRDGSPTRPWNDLAHAGAAGSPVSRGRAGRTRRRLPVSTQYVHNRIVPDVAADAAATCALLARLRPGGSAGRARARRSSARSWPRSTV